MCCLLDTNGIRIMLWSCSNSFDRIRWGSMKNRFIHRQCYVRGLCETRIKCVSNLLVFAQPSDSWTLFCARGWCVSLFHIHQKIIILVVLLVVPFGRTPVHPALKPFALHGNQEACLRASLTVQLNWSIESKCLRARTHLYTGSKQMYIHLTHKCPWKTISIWCSLYYIVLQVLSSTRKGRCRTEKTGWLQFNTDAK